MSGSLPALFAGVGSGVALESIAVLVRLPTTPEPTWRTSVNACAGAPPVRAGRVPVTVPLAPTAVLSVRVQPAGYASATKAEPVGLALHGALPSSALGPLLLPVTV